MLLRPVVISNLMKKWKNDYRRFGDGPVLN